MDLLQQAGLPEDQQQEQDVADEAGAEAGALVMEGVGGGAGLLHRSASVSSLDECSQRASDLRLTASLRNLGSSASSNRLQMIESKLRKIAGHPVRCLEGLFHLQRADVLTDVTLVAGNVEVRAHKNVLAANSPYFHAMFTENFEERLSKSVTLSEVDPQALAALVKFIYTAEVEISEDNVQALLTAANLLQLSEVRDACCEFLASQLHPTNCLGIRSFADLHGCADLLTTSENFVALHFADVLDTDEFLALSVKQVAQLIASDIINVPSEERIYEAVMNWVQFDTSSRGCYLPELMQHVRLPLLSKEYLLQRVDSGNGTGLFDQYPKCKDYLIEALRFHLAGQSLGETSRIFGSSSRTKARQPVGLPKVILAIGGQAPKAVRSVEGYDFQEERWIQLTDMETRRCRSGVAIVRGKVYAVGGFNGHQRVKTVDEYDPCRDKWTAVANMTARRSTLGVGVHNDRIFAIGGFDGSIGLNSAEVLDLSVSCGAQEWRRIASMATRRSSVGVGVLGGLVYAVGGYDGNSRQCLSSVEVYNPETDVWSWVNDMTARRSGAGVGVLNGLLYSVGGHDGPLVRKSVECFSPERNAWTSVAEMNCSRRNAGVVAHNGMIYVIGGDDGSTNLASVEQYNPKTDTWTLLVAQLNLGRSYTGVCVIEKPDCISQ